MGESIASSYWIGMSPNNTKVTAVTVVAVKCKQKHVATFDSEELAGSSGLYGPLNCVFWMIAFCHVDLFTKSVSL